MTPYKIPSDQQFYEESEKFLQICNQHCTCTDGWHFVWAALKASKQRRSIYYQQPLLAELLSPAASNINKILIAGAADSGLLMILHSIFGSKVDYTVFDICNAPLEQMKEFAQQHGISLRTQSASLTGWNSDQQYDLIFVHNTLNFLPVEAMADVLLKFASHLTEDGRLACGMRYELATEASSMRRNELLHDTISKMVQSTYATRPDLMSLVSSKIDAYVDQKKKRGVQTLRPDDFKAIWIQAGYVMVSQYQDDQTPSGILNNTPTDSSIRSDGYRLKTAHPERCRQGQ